MIIDLDDLPHTKHAHELVGAEHGDVPISLILVHSAPGTGPALHRHPYAEVFIVESGQATFQLGDERIVVDGGHIVVGPPEVPHGFTNTGSGELRLTAIHCAPKFNTEWISGPDPAWASPRGVSRRRGHTSTPNDRSARWRVRGREKRCRSICRGSATRRRRGPS